MSSSNLAVSDSTARFTQASRLISSSCAWAAGAGLIPLPVVDVAALAAVQATLANDIATLYGESFKHEAVKSTISVLLATLLPGIATSSIASAVKVVPIIGTLLGIATFPALASASTYAMGRVLVRHFEGGGTAATFSADSIKEDLKREFNAARAETAPA
jgi:uncharacterized protein (DUF697 family)